ncbi:MAG: hypothetical protein H6728_06110 [Myxococcales bacterium]|nr:hypothetical protein [Myxococcales bacterium]
MPQRASWLRIGYLTFFSLLLATSLACGPPGGVGNQQDGAINSEGGSSNEGAQQDGTVSDGSANEQPQQDGANPDGTAAESTTQDGTTNEQGTPDGAVQDGTAPDGSPQDNGDTEPALDGGSTDTTPDATKTRCEGQLGYCDLFTNGCKDGYEVSPDTLDCPGGRSALCCVPKMPPVQCATDKDCPPTCRGNGVCEQIEYKCVAGMCTAGQPLSQPNARCDNATGQCVPLSAGCQSNCDCPQGLLCANGRCLSGTKPAYCCTNTGCPVGETCQNPDGTNGTCTNNTPTDCEKKGGQCIPQNGSCPPNSKMDTAVSCGTVRSLVCCLPTTNPCATIRCQGPTCTPSSTGGCNETTYTCDPSLGQCVPTTKALTATCRMDVNDCVQNTPGCSNNLCSLKTTTVKLSCSQSGTSCVQTTPGCSGTQCTVKTTTIANASCDSTTGKCSPKTAGCQSNCDCTQGLLCANGQCIAGIVPAYCCTNPGCPAGSTCQNPDKTSGTCPSTTQTDCERKGGQCIVQNGNCPPNHKMDTAVSCGNIRALVCCLPATNPCATIRCSGPTCSASSTGGCSQTTYTCDPNLGQCVPTTKTTTPTCNMNGTVCVQSTPICSSNQCAVSATSTAPSCTQSGTSCIQSGALCSNNQCVKGSQTIANSTCDSTTGQCTLPSNTCALVGGVCQSSRLPCPPGTATNTNLSCGSLTLSCCAPRVP